MCNVYKVVPSALVDGEEEVQETILHIRWHRSNEYNVFSLIPDENGLVRPRTALSIRRRWSCFENTSNQKLLSFFLDLMLK